MKMSPKSTVSIIVENEIVRRTEEFEIMLSDESLLHNFLDSCRWNYFSVIFFHFYLNRKSSINDKKDCNQNEEHEIMEKKNKNLYKEEKIIKGKEEKTKINNNQKFTIFPLFLSLFLLLFQFQVTESYLNQYNMKIKLSPKINLVRNSNKRQKKIISQFCLHAYEVDDEEKKKEKENIFSKFPFILPFRSFISIKFSLIKNKINNLSAKTMDQDSIENKEKIIDDENISSDINETENIREEDSSTLLDKNTDEESMSDKLAIVNTESKNDNSKNAFDSNYQLDERTRHSVVPFSVPQGFTPIKHALVSFQTAGNWKKKRNTWKKYKKNTGWRDPYRDGEDSGIEGGGTFFWRFFAEMISDSMTGRKNSKSGIFFERHSSVIDELGSVDGKREKKELEIKKYESRVEDSDMQDGVIGCIQSTYGRFFIRNAESSFDFTEEDSLEEPNHDRDILMERELMKSIRNYSNPPRSKF